MFITTKRKPAGFTLLEILVALGVFTIVSLIATTTLHTLLNQQHHYRAKMTEFNALQTALLLISNDLKQVVDRPITNAAQEHEPALWGANHAIRFTHAGLVNPDNELNRSTLQRVSYRVSDHRLIRDSWEVLDQSSQSSANTRVLLTHVADVQFQYLDTKNQFQNEWKPKSSDTHALPTAVELSLTLETGATVKQLILIAHTLEENKNNENTIENE